MNALIAGTVLALAALSYVLYPLLVTSGAPDTEDVPSGPGSSGNARDQAVEALREIEFDRETGKLSDADYGSLKASYTQRAITAMRRESDGPVCGRCGPRPESDAKFCSRCGIRLSGLVGANG